MRKPKTTLVAIVISTILIFIADTLTTSAVCVSVLYVLTLLVALRARSTIYIVFAGIAGVALTTVSFILTPSDVLSNHAETSNYYLSVFTITLTAYLSLKTVKAEEATSRNRESVATASRGVSLSEFATATGHELNQPLAAIVANGGAARRWLLASPPNIGASLRSLEAVSQNAERAGAVVNGLRRLASNSSAERKRFDLLLLLRETMELLQSDFAAARTQAHLRLDDKVLQFEGDRVLIQQVVINIIRNAIESFEQNQAQDREITIRVSKNGGDVRISFHDTGVAVKSDQIDKIFDAFYTTKLNGMGIGLAVCRSIVDAHGGSLRAFSNDVQGMTFEIEMPVGRLI